MTGHPKNAEWFCKGCGALHKLDMDTGAMELAAQGIPVKGSLTCESCMTRHEIQDIVIGKYSSPRQNREAHNPDNDTTEIAIGPTPALRLILGAFGLILNSLESFLLLIWGVFGDGYVPQWFIWQVVDHGLSLALLSGLSLILVGLGLTATYWIRPQLWYLAGIMAFILAIRVVVFWFLGEDTLFGGASTLSEGLVVWLVYGIRWLPIYPAMVFCLAVGALQLKPEIGVLQSGIIFWSGLLLVFSVAVFLLGIPLSLYTDFPVGEIALFVCLAFCGIAMFQLSRR